MTFQKPIQVSVSKLPCRALERQLLGAKRPRWPAVANRLFGGHRKVACWAAVADLRKQPVQEPEVAAGDADDRRYRLRVGYAATWEHTAHLRPVLGKQPTHLFGAQRPEGMEELRIASNVVAEVSPSELI